MEYSVVCYNSSILASCWGSLGLSSNEAGNTERDRQCLLFRNVAITSRLIYHASEILMTFAVNKLHCVFQYNFVICRQRSMFILWKCFLFYIDHKWEDGYE